MKRPTIKDDGFAWVERYMDVWARWMRHPGLRLSAPSRTPAFMGEVRDGYGDPEEIHELAGQDRAIQVIEATLDCCSPKEKAAVMHVCLQAEYPYFYPVGVAYCDARQKIGVRLRANDFGPLDTGLDI